MPKKAVDYQKTIIYKIVCNDLKITDNYVGSTTNFVSRKSNHKYHCTNEKSPNYNFKIYEIIRKNCGWENFSMIEIEKFPCNDVNEATKRERYHFENLNSNLNSKFPQRDVKEWYITNRHIINNKKKEYREKNKEKISMCEKEYRKNNKEKMSIRDKEKYIKFKEKIQERHKEKVLCGCGIEINKSHKLRHLKTKKHKDLMLCKNVTSV
jgi:hypothetical protein